MSYDLQVWDPDAPHGFIQTAGAAAQLTKEMSPAEAFTAAEAARIMTDWMYGRSPDGYRQRPS